MSRDIYSQVSSLQNDAENYYDILGVQLNATTEEIKRLYQDSAKKVHPDKSGDASSTAFNKANTAYRILTDSVARALYDIKMGLVDDVPQRRKEMHRAKRREADIHVQNIRSTAEAVRQSELRWSRDQQGLVIHEAFYGDIYIPDVSPVNVKHVGKTINVEIPLQAAVTDGLLFIHNDLSLSFLDGFFDPNQGQDEFENCLYIKYSYSGMLHESVFKDNECICLPAQEHLIPEHEMDILESDLEEIEIEFGHSQDLYELARQSKSFRMGQRVTTRWEQQARLSRTKAQRRKMLAGILCGIGLTTAAVLQYTGVYDFLGALGISSSPTATKQPDNKKDIEQSSSPSPL